VARLAPVAPLATLARQFDAHTRSPGNVFVEQ